MRLISISYCEHEGTDREWVLDELTLGQRNLLVGKNATGKTRALSVIGSLAKMLTGHMRPDRLFGAYTARSDDSGSETVYKIRSENEVVTSEQLIVANQVLLDRGADGVGRIYAAKIGGGTEIDFQTPQNELAAVVRRDAIQHPFLQPIHDWAAGVRHYHFGTALGRENLALIAPPNVRGIPEADDRDADQVVGIFRRAEREFGERLYKNAVLHDLQRMAYPADDVGVGPPISIRIFPPVPGEVMGLWVKESGLKAITDQPSMSQGMFRVLSVLILSNYLYLTHKAGCILIDDIGEGLDFERSCRLVNLLREKTERAAWQLITTTNDKFVMNEVPLKEWSVLVREGGRLKALNHSNSPEMFEDFRFTGLSNFSFLEMDFANHPAIPVANE